MRKFICHQGVMGALDVSTATSSFCDWTWESKDER